MAEIITNLNKGVGLQYALNTKQDTGKRWIDGKPIYSVCATATLPNTGQGIIDLSAYNVGKVLGHKILYTNPTETASMAAPYYETATNFVDGYFLYADRKFYMNFGSDNRGAKIIYCIEFTE